MICFVDFTKAFDSVNQQKLWHALKSYTTLNPAYINLLAKLYETSKTRIHTGIGVTELIDLLRGVKQGDIASAILFCLALMVILLQTFESLTCGISIGDIMLMDVSYADDIAIIAGSTEEMNIILERLRAFAEEFGLSINIKKTKIMMIGEHNPQDAACVIGDTVLDIVTSFEYLGRVLSQDSDDHLAVSHRIARGWTAFQKVKSILMSRHVPMKRKLKTYETYIIPCVLYASETIIWSAKEVKRVQKFENDIMRWLTNRRLRTHTSIEQLYALTGAKGLVGEIKSRKARWYGHVKRSSLPVRATVEGVIRGRRKRGRPRRRWIDDLPDWLKTGRHTIDMHVRDKSLWRRTCKGLKGRL